MVVVVVVLFFSVLWLLFFLVQVLLRLVELQVVDEVLLLKISDLLQYLLEVHVLMVEVLLPLELLQR